LLVTKALYRLLIEVMANTWNHAYERCEPVHNRVPQKNNGYPWGRWWLLARNLPDCKKVQFAFLDVGKSMPVTIRKGITERIQQQLSNLIPTTAADSRLVMSALNGDFRTGTGETKRGNALPAIRALSDDRRIHSLKIVSRHAFVDVAERRSVDLRANFKGTLLSWEVFSSPLSESRSCP